MAKFEFATSIFDQCNKRLHLRRRQNFLILQVPKKNRTTEWPVRRKYIADRRVVITWSTPDPTYTFWELQLLKSPLNLWLPDRLVSPVLALSPLLSKVSVHHSFRRANLNLDDASNWGTPSLYSLPQETMGLQSTTYDQIYLHSNKNWGCRPEQGSWYHSRYKRLPNPVCQFLGIWLCIQLGHNCWKAWLP